MTIHNTPSAVPPDMPRDVLIPTDGSPLYADALEHALATFPDGNITLLYIIDSRYTTADDDELRPERIFSDLLAIAEQHDIEVDTDNRRRDARLRPPCRPHLCAIGHSRGLSTNGLITANHSVFGSTPPTRLRQRRRRGGPVAYATRSARLRYVSKISRAHATASGLSVVAMAT